MFGIKFIKSKYNALRVSQKEMSGYITRKLFKANNFWWYVLISKPDLYLYKIVLNTVMSGVVTTVIYFVLDWNGYHRQSIPSSFHSLIAFVLAMVLVFRTNTAYDRWWEARRMFATLETKFIYCVSVLKTKRLNEKDLAIFAKLFNSSLDAIRHFLVTDNSNSEKRKFFDRIYETQQHIVDVDLKEKGKGNACDLATVESTIKDILDCFTSLERIRDTPIPTSYSLHIKLSIFAYLMTLPFGMFFEMGVWSIPLVMILYFIIAGVEIISNEIENPFTGDPNDLPVDKYINKLKDEINDELVNAFKAKS